MFKPEYINELINGNLSDKGYTHFLMIVSANIRKYKWPNFIVISDVKSNSSFWTPDEIKELTHQFFEWVITKGKLDNLNKIPENYLSYYFSQIFISFISFSIKSHQQKEGLSFEKCKELVLSVSKEDLVNENIDGIVFVFNSPINKENILLEYEIDNALNYLSKIPILDTTKQFKPLVRMAIGDILNTLESPIPIDKLVNVVYKLFDQKIFLDHSLSVEPVTYEVKPKRNPNHLLAIKSLLQGISKNDARLLTAYLFLKEGEISLSELASKYNLPKSTLHHKVETFKKKISAAYTPENEEDGMLFMQNIYSALDDIPK